MLECALPIGQEMANTNHLTVEVHYFPVPAEEVAERRRTLRTLLLRGARRSIEQQRDRNREVRKPEEMVAVK